MKLLRLNARLADLNRKTANPKISISGAARAQAEIAAIDLELDRLDEKAASSGRGGLLSRILYGAEGAAGEGEGGLTGMLPGGGSLAALAAAVPVIEALATEAVGLASGFAAAGAGAGSFALLAMPAFKSVSGALTQIQADQTAYDRALTKTAKNTALKHLQADLAKLDPAERGAVKGIQQLESSFSRMAKAFEPAAFKIFNDGLKIANNLLPAVTPLANAFAGALDPLLKQFGKFTASAGFKDWLKQFTALAGPAVTAIGEGLGKVGVAIGKLLTTMNKKDVVHAINIAFDVLAGAIDFAGYAVRRLMSNWDGMSSAFRRTRHDIASAGHDIAHVFDDLRHDAADLAHNVAAHFDEIRHNVADLAHNIASRFDQIRANIHRWADDAGRDVTRVVNWFKALPGRIKNALGDLSHLLWNAGVQIVEGLLHGLASKFGEVRHTISSWGADIKGWFADAMGIFSPSKVFEQHGKMIGAGLIQGMDGSLPGVKSAALRMAAAAVTKRYPSGGYGSGGPGSGGASGNGPLVIELRWTGGGADDDLMQLLRRKVRAQGGSPEIFQRKVVFR